MFEEYYDPCEGCSAATDYCYYSCPLVDKNVTPTWMMCDFEEEDEDDMIRPPKAISIFYEFFERDGGIPTKKEFDKWFYNKEQGDANNYYYQVKRQFLKKLEEKGVNIK